MRYAIRLLLAAVVAAMAMAAMASPAAAQESAIEVQEEATGDHCTDVMVVDHMAQGGCEMSVHGEEIRLENPSLGFLSVCENSYDANIGEDGTGWIYNQQFATVSAPHSGTCRSEVITEPDGHAVPWEIVGAGETGGDPHAEHVTVSFSVINHFFGFEFNTDCTVEVQAQQIDHINGRFEANQAPCPNGSHVTGTWESVSEHPGGIEVVHL